MSQYKDLQERHTDTVVLQMAGGFYRSYGDNAKVLSDITGYKLLKSKEYGCRCGFPINAAEKVKTLLSERNVGYVFYQNNDVTDEKQGDSEAYKGYLSHEYVMEKPNIPSIGQNINSGRDECLKEKKQKILMVTGTGKTYKMALSEIRTEIEEMIKAGMIIDSVSTMDATKRAGNVKIIGLMIIRGKIQ